MSNIVTHTITQEDIDASTFTIDGIECPFDNEEEISVGSIFQCETWTNNEGEEIKSITLIFEGEEE